MQRKCNDNAMTMQCNEEAHDHKASQYKMQWKNNTIKLVLLSTLAAVAAALNDATAHNDCNKTFLSDGSL